MTADSCSWEEIFFFFKALKSDVYKASHTMKGAFASISKLSSHEKAILLRDEEWELMFRWDYDDEASCLHQLKNTRMIGHPKVISENLGTLLISLNLGKMKLFTPERCFSHSSNEGKWQDNVPHITHLCWSYTGTTLTTVKKESLWVPRALNKTLEKEWSEISEVWNFIIKKSVFICLFLNKELHLHQKLSDLFIVFSKTDSHTEDHRQKKVLLCCL